MSDSRFAYPEGLAFECTRCGDCCRGWNVMLGPGESERVEGFDWRGRDERLVEENVLSRQSGRSVLARRDDGACVFLGAANQCLIHEHFGGDAKPLLCRMFPFGFLQVGDRVAVDVSFACRSISEATGRPLAVREPEWTKLVADAGDGARHPFSKKYDVDGALLWELEHLVLDVVSNTALTMLQRVRGVLSFMRLAMTSDPRTDAARQMRRVMVEGVPKLVREADEDAPMDKTQRAIFFHFLFLHLNPTPPELLAASGGSRIKQVKRRVQAADGFKHDKAKPWVDNQELEVDYRAVASVDAGFLLENGGARLVERYLEAKIVGQRFMREGERALPFVEAVPRLLLTFPMLVWCAKAFAATEKALEVGESHARRALRLLDRSFGEVNLSELPAKQRKAWRFVLLETELAACASHDMLASSQTPADGG